MQQVAKTPHFSPVPLFRLVFSQLPRELLKLIHLSLLHCKPSSRLSLWINPGGFKDCSSTAKSENHTNHNQGHKWHRNGIKKPKKQRHPSLKELIQNSFETRGLQKNTTNVTQGVLSKWNPKCHYKL